MLINPNPMWLVDSITLAKVTGLDEYQKPTYADPVTYAHVRFDHTVVYSGSGNNRTIQKTGTVYLYGFNQDLSLPSGKEWLQAKVTATDGTEYIVQTVSPYQQDTSTDLYSVELGVI